MQSEQINKSRIRITGFITKFFYFQMKGKKVK